MHRVGLPEYQLLIKDEHFFSCPTHTIFEGCDLIENDKALRILGKEPVPTGLRVPQGRVSQIIIFY